MLRVSDEAATQKVQRRSVSRENGESNGREFKPNKYTESGRIVAGLHFTLEAKLAVGGRQMAGDDLADSWHSSIEEA